MNVKLSILMLTIAMDLHLSLGVQLPSVFTLDERLKIFGTDTTLSLPDINYAAIRELNIDDLKPFRKRPPTVLQYEVTMDNETFTITLRPNNMLLSPDCLIKQFYNHSAVPTISPCGDQQNCFYTGSSDAHNDSWVAANVCGGLNGIISIGNTSLYVHPLKDADAGVSKAPSANASMTSSPNAARDLYHVVYRYQSEKHVCRFDEPPSERLHVVNPDSRRRKKRSGQSDTGSRSKYIETSLFVDPSMARFHGDDIKSYVFTIINIASKLYRSPSIGTDIHLVVKELVIFDTATEFDVDVSTDAHKTLNSFCRWQRKFDDTRTSDVNILMTRLDIAYNSDKETTGLSNIRGGCSPDFNCALVEDNGPTMGITFAHEVGHLLGMIHDNSFLKEINNTCHPRIMSGRGQSGREGFTWSPCSARELRNAIKSGDLDCLNNVPVGSSWTYHHESGAGGPLPGTLYTADKQCALLLRTKARACSDHNGDPCVRIACEAGDNGCNVYSQPLIDGTDCNNTRHWCMNGQCVAMNAAQNTLPVDGAWSDWGATYSVCSATCGGGVKIKRRRCDNPPPQYGGQSCPGLDFMSKMCNFEKCPTDSKTNQCEHMAQRHQYNGTWIPKPFVYGDEDCKIRCLREEDGSSLSHPSTFTNGTVCTQLDLSVAFGRCFNARCMKFGCDGVMGSGKKYDVCGACDGPGRCREMNNTYIGRLQHLLNNNNSQPVFTIPQGSTGISIHQNSSAVQLGLMIGTENLLDTITMATRAIFTAAGMRIEYNVNPETVRIIGPATDNILVVARYAQDFRPMLSEAHTEEYSVVYTYHVPSETRKYSWASATQPCTRSCGRGWRQKTITCWSIEGPVDDSFCDITQRPNEQTEPCNNFPCPPRWKASEWSHCSVTCGVGTKTRTFTCRQLDNGVDKELGDRRCGGLARAPHRISCNNGACPGIWRTVNQTACSKTCGQGMATRTVQCFRHERALTPTDVTNCMSSTRPPSQITCFTKPCIRSPDCQDIRDDCPDFGADICYGKYSDWAEEHCKATCRICDVRDLDDCQAYIDYDVVAQTCHGYPTWANENCPKMCSKCHGCDDRPEPDTPCARIDRKYCTMQKFVPYMKLHCPQRCCYCGSS